MATTIPQAFLQFSQNLEITSLQENTTSTRQQNVRSVLMQELDVLDSFLTGSYRRNTIIAPLTEADVDIFVVLDPKYYDPLGHAALLDRVKRALQRQYQTSAISRAGQAVTISFKDFKVDIVPGFNRQGGGFLIPDSIGRRWISTNPKTHVTLWAKLNSQKNGDFVRVIKMLKQWNRSHSQLLRSFHLEAIAFNVFQNVTISDLSSGTRYFFEHAKPYISSGVQDPSGLGGDVGSYLDTGQKIMDVVDRLDTALKQAREAESLASAGRTRDAFGKWSTIFGDYFPAYG